MSCGTNLKKCNYKSIQRAFNILPQEFTATGTTLNILGSKATDTGVSVCTKANSFSINCRGTYHISADVTAAPTAAGNLILQLYRNGVSLPCAINTFTVASGNSYTLHTETDLYLKPDDEISIKISGVEGQVTWLGASCIKWA